MKRPRSVGTAKAMQRKAKVNKTGMKFKDYFRKQKSVMTNKSFLYCLFFPGLMFLITGCIEEEHIITEVNFEEAEFAPFVEPDFPFITTSVDARNLGPGFPAMNVTPRCLALQLGNESYACFDTDLLRWSVGWTGEFLPMVTMAQISYSDFNNKDNQIPGISGEPKLATGHYPGWVAGEPSFSDPRPPALHPDDPSWGPLPEDLGRWNGVYLTDSGPVLSYSVRGTDIYELPGSVAVEDETVFTRTFRVGPGEESLFLSAAEVPSAVRSEIQPGRAEIHHNDSTSTVMLLSATSEEDVVTLDIREERYMTASVSGREHPVEFTLMVWTGSSGGSGQIETHSGNTSLEIPSVREGAENLWADRVQTRGRVSPDTAAYVVDELTLPVPNPWNRNVRVVDIAFFEDGRAAVVTFEGDVWIVEGINRDLDSLEWTRFASGLYEPQSIEIVDGEIYTYGKDGIIHLHDLNGDGAADFYENFSNLITQSIETREWASDMVAKPDGGFYVAKGGALDMGPAGLSEAVASGFRTGSQHTGVILEISEDGRSAGLFASGFRGPYLGIHPETGLLTASDQQGHFVPSTPLFVVHEGDFAGVEITAHRDPVPEETPPLLWIPHEVDRSGTSQVWVTSDRMGSLNNGLIHLSYGRPGLFRVLIDSTGSGMQGGISTIPGEFPAPMMKGIVNPEDGQLYIAGFTLWGTNSEGVAALTRLRYTGKESLLPASFRAGEGGVILRFDEELDEEAVQAISNYRVQRWNYQRTEEYGSGHYRPDGSPGQELLPVFSAHVSDDRKGVFLAVPGIEKVQQMQLSYSLKTASGTALDDDFWFTVHHAEPIDLAAEGFTGLDTEDLLVGSPAGTGEDPEGMEEPVTAERGEELFRRSGCIGCHTTDGSEGTGVGPTMLGLFGSERNFQDSPATVADEAYIREAIIQPGTEIVEGYDEGMPSFLGILSDDEIESIILYIRSLAE